MWERNSRKVRMEVRNGEQRDRRAWIRAQAAGSSRFSDGRCKVIAGKNRVPAQGPPDWDGKMPTEIKNPAAQGANNRDFNIRFRRRLSSADCSITSLEGKRREREIARETAIADIRPFYYRADQVPCRRKRRSPHRWHFEGRRRMRLPLQLQQPQDFAAVPVPIFQPGLSDERVGRNSLRKRRQKGENRLTPETTNTSWPSSMALRSRMFRASCFQMGNFVFDRETMRQPP